MPPENKSGDSKLEFVNRVEVIDDTGRAYVNKSVLEVELVLQDENQTLKLFIKSGSREPH